MPGGTRRQQHPGEAGPDLLVSQGTWGPARERTIAECSALSRGDTLPRTPGGHRPGPRHCWVTRFALEPCPGVLVEWSRHGEDNQEDADTCVGWFGRVVHALVNDGRVVLMGAFRCARTRPWRWSGPPPAG